MKRTETMPVVLTQKLFHFFFAHVYVDTGVVVVDARSRAGVGAADGPLEQEEHQAPESPQHRMLPAPRDRRAATTENPSPLPQHYSRCLALSTSVVVPPGVPNPRYPSHPYLKLISNSNITTYLTPNRTFCVASAFAWVLSF